MPRLSLLILSEQGAYDGKYFDFLINFCKKRQAFVVMFIDLNRLFWNIIYHCQLLVALSPKIV